MQEDFKKSWEALAEATVKGTYNTDVVWWTCDCGAQKYHAYLLCKHLVHTAGTPSPSWWVSFKRYHIPPFYTVPIDGTIAEPPETKRDHDWLPRREPRLATTSSATTMDQAAETYNEDGEARLVRCLILYLDVGTHNNDIHH